MSEADNRVGNPQRSQAGGPQPMAGRLLDINGLVVDQDRIEYQRESPCGMQQVRFHGEEGQWVASINALQEALLYPITPWRSRSEVFVVVAQLWMVRSWGPMQVNLDNEGRWFILLRGRYVSWAPLLDLAVEAGLELPEVSRPVVHG